MWLASKHFVKIDQAITSFLLQHEYDDFVAFYGVRKYWSMIIGEPLAKKTLPLKIQKRTLFIGVQDPAYAEALRYYEKKIIHDYINQIIQKNKVIQVRFRVLDPSQFQQEYQKQIVTIEESPFKHTPTIEDHLFQKEISILRKKISNPEKKIKPIFMLQNHSSQKEISILRKKISNPEKKIKPIFMLQDHSSQKEIALLRNKLLL